MSPIALVSENILPTVPSPKVLPTDIPRRPSPWHEIAHSLSTTSLPPYHSRRASSSTVSVAEACTPSSDALNTPPLISSSQALREWEEKLSHPQSDVSRHKLIDERYKTTKLAAERDKAGYIEYKLKLIDPTSERFERLITQLMWRLKQGRNEAIYELGLADDGTVIGLPRSQMDASLRTLELMASEVGATVIILKEIVLHPKATILPKSVNLNGAKPICKNDDKKKVQGRRRKSYTPRDPGMYGGTRPKKMIFDPLDLSTPSDSEEEFDDNGYIEDKENRLDPDDTFFCIEPDHEERDGINTTNDNSQYSSGFNSSSPGRDQNRRSSYTSKKADNKRRKSAVRSEARRLDLLRGDGTNPMWNEMTDISHSNKAVELSQFTSPHQPIRPSSLRLATPSTSTDKSFLDDLLHIPLDNLSLSFADVRSIPEDPEMHSPLSTSAETFVSTLDKLVDDQGLTENKSTTAEDSPEQAQIEEMICVEALVVRKLQHDEDGAGTGEDDDEEEEEWGYGGEEDVWGFGVDE
ncbi:uncharacterized protein I206_107870 [Kwoniella pini CBS 10737]|uniref:Uncharacterized protein n=1 Tax=Kwoniella pini CBS 10737 TaxID=1296096 RepID=A0A1B9HYG9_9TREE|nr:uncharacterized protein I206_06201 [Kwoniella pini CBS 10737]OCF48333.1 hypothetical protein I206_06201 [Kwoniella pini CBS 10737]